MNEKLFDELSAMKDRDLFDFVTEKDSSQRKWAALYILETRRARISSKAAVAAAWASGLSAMTALIMLIIYIINRAA